jgi:hypothetical protein
MYIMYNNVKINKIGQLESHLVPGRLFDNFGQCFLSICLCWIFNNFDAILFQKLSGAKKYMNRRAKCPGAKMVPDPAISGCHPVCSFPS